MTMSARIMRSVISNCGSLGTGVIIQLGATCIAPHKYAFQGRNGVKG